MAEIKETHADETTEELVFYVSPEGDDSWSGRLPEPNKERTDGPFASVIAARNAIRRLRREKGFKGAVVVFLRGGTYQMTEPLVLCPEDSNTTYAAYHDERAILSGGRRVGPWEPVEGTRLWVARIPEVAEGKWNFRQLFVNGKRRTRARTPNEGWFPIVRGIGYDVENRTAFVFRKGDIKRWSDWEEAEVVIYHSWETARLRIADVDERNYVVRFTGPSWWPFKEGGRWPEQRYYVENIRDALDSPGEWFLDRREGKVYYWPLPGEDMRNAEVVAPYLHELVRFEGDPEHGLFVKNVTLKGLVFCYADWELEPEGHSDRYGACNTPATIMADGAVNCAIEDCEIAHVGWTAIWLRRGCKNNRIVRNRIHDLGVGGIRVGELAPVAKGVVPTREESISSHNVIENNHIFDGGHVYAAGPGIWIGQSHHNVVAHNDIHHFSYAGILIGCTPDGSPNHCHHNIVEYNHVHHVLNGQLNDCGGIMTEGLSAGTVIRNNIVHDIWPYTMFGWGIYFDCFSSGYLVENNVVYNTQNGGVMMHGPQWDIVVRNNVFAFSTEWALYPGWPREGKKAHTFERNIVYFTQGQLFHPQCEAALQHRHKAGNLLGVFDYNLYWNPNEPVRFFNHDFEQWKAFGLDQHSVIADPLFVNAEGYDFRLKPDSPALKLGIESIDVSKVGLYGAMRQRVAAKAKEGHDA